MKVLGKRKPFKTNNSSGDLYGFTFLMPLIWGEGRDAINALEESNCTAIDVMSTKHAAVTFLHGRDRKIFACSAKKRALQIFCTGPPQT